LIKDGVQLGMTEQSHLVVVFGGREEEREINRVLTLKIFVSSTIEIQVKYILYHIGRN